MALSRMAQGLPNVISELYQETRNWGRHEDRREVGKQLVSVALPSVAPGGPQLEAGLVNSRIKKEYTFLLIN